MEKSYVILISNDDFFYYTEIEDRNNFFRGLDQEKRDLAKSKKVRYLNMDLLDNQNEIADMPYHKKILEFYRQKRLFYFK